MPPRGDGYDHYRREINNLIAARLSTGRNNTVTEKVLTISVQAQDFEDARTQLTRVSSEAIAALRSVGGARASVMSGSERAGFIHRILRPGEPMTFEYRQLIGSGQSTKDVLAPWEIGTSDPAMVKLGNSRDSYYQVLCLRNLPNWLNDRLVKEIADLPIDVSVNLHIRPIEQEEGLKLVKRQIAGMEMQIATERKKAAKQFQDDSFIPHELRSAYTEADQLREKLEQSNEKLFSTTIVVGVAGGSVQALEENVKRVQNVASKHSCSFEPMRYMQLDGLNATLPLGVCHLPIYRTMTTAMAAILVPFTTQELMHEGGLFYGVNALSKNLIVGDRTRTMNANAFVLGTTGSGKSQASKFELMSVFLSRPNDDIIIIDPEREYRPVADAIGASVVEVSASSAQCINPLHLDKDIKTADTGSPIRQKAEFTLSMCEVLLGGDSGLDPVSRSLIDRAATQIYQAYWRDNTALPPTMVDLYEAIKAQPEAQAQVLATSLELYATGSFSGFARQTNVDTSNRVMVYDISQLGSDLKTFGMMVVLEQVWSQVARNRAQGKRTWLYIDEFHLLFSNDYAATYCQAIYKRARKWGLLPTGITQNIEELLGNERARLMLANCDVLQLLNQQPTDADALQALFGWSNQQREYFTNVPAGSGMLKMGQTVVPFDNTMVEDMELYRLFTTRFEETVA